MCKKALLLLISLTTTAVGILSQPKDLAINPEERNFIIRSIVENLNKNYVSIEKAKLVEKIIQERHRNGRYSKINSAVELSDTLTRHLRELTHDEHLGTIFSLEPILDEDSKVPTAEETEKFRRFAGSHNFGFEKVERLPGNVGFMELNGFIRAEWGAETAIAALNFLSNTDALIIDLRYNGGGEPGLIQLICTYFFDKSTHLNSIHWRENQRVEQFWTLPYVQGKKYLNKPVYILTSKNTFSAPEDLAYSLQVQKKAIIVGDKTRGGANSGKVFKINEHFAIYIPIGIAINPVTGKNWEGGVEPDISVDSKDALKKAHRLAILNLINAASSPEKKKQLEAILEEIPQ